MPQPLVGHIIGKGGAFVREVLAVTGVQVSHQFSDAVHFYLNYSCVLQYLQMVFSATLSPVLVLNNRRAKRVLILRVLGKYM